MTIKITNFINAVIDIYEQDIKIEKCCICRQKTEVIHIKYGFDSFCRKIWLPKQYCRKCYNIRFCKIENKK